MSSANDEGDYDDYNDVWNVGSFIYFSFFRKMRLLRSSYTMLMVVVDVIFGDTDETHPI